MSGPADAGAAGGGDRPGEVLVGRCLCGAVTITAIPEAGAGVSACHCVMCQRWSGGAFMGFVAPAAGVSVTGEVQTFPSSPFADRAFCPRCGSHLWFRDHGGDYELPPGLFAGAAGMDLAREVYADRALASCRFRGEHPRIAAAEYEARNPFVEGDDP